MFGGKLHRVTCNAFEPDVRFWISLSGVIFYFRQLNLLLILMAIGMLNISGRLIRKVPLNSSILALYQPKTKWWKHSITKNQPNLDACGVKLLRNGFLMKFSIVFPKTVIKLYSNGVNEILKRILKSIILKMQPLGSVDWSRNNVTMPNIALKIILLIRHDYFQSRATAGNIIMIWKRVGWMAIRRRLYSLYV